MKWIQIAALAVIAVFYIAYFTKMILQRKQGVKTDQIGKGKKTKQLRTVEILMKIASYSVVTVEIFSILFDFRMWRSRYAWAGIGMAVLGVCIFIVAMVTMKESWRAGIPEKAQTELITTGIYRIIRNPAFFGFDLLYIGVLIAFFNYLHLIFVLFAICMFHLQILQEEKFLTATFGEKYTEYKKHTGRYFIFDKAGSKKKTMITAVSVVVCIALAVGGFVIYGNCQTARLPALSFRQALEYATKHNPDAVITVGVIKNGQASYKVYGENGKELPSELHTYEIGSLTKTFTAALINKAIQDGKINIDDTIDQYLSLPKSHSYPTVKSLLTHTSGYGGYYFDFAMTANFLVGRNDFYGVSKQSVLEKAGSLNMSEETGSFCYSNYGYAVLGLVLESVYDSGYTTLLNHFVQSDLGLQNTKISTENGDLGNYWAWKENDAYLSAGAVTSDISDMLSYAKMQLEGNPYLAECQKSLKTIHATTDRYAAMDIRIDEIGMSWMIDSQNGIVWHNGGTGNYNAYLGFCAVTGTAVVVLSNLAPNARIPATVLGIKRLLEE